MPIPEITKDMILEAMGQRVAEMDHLVQGVIEDIGKCRVKFEMSLDKAIQALRLSYFHDNRIPRLFILDTIEGQLRLLEEMDADPA